MILHRIRIEGFGALSGEVRFDPRRINLITGPNESGKSTLMAAMTAALYGLDDDRRSYRGKLTPLEHYRPWNGNTFAVELTLEVDGEKYTINRNFGRSKTTVFREGVGDVSEEFRVGPDQYAIGEFLLKVNVDQFARSALWLQPGPGRWSGVEVTPDESLSAMLERQASSVSGDASAQAALTVLETALRQYEVGDTRILVSTQIKRLEIRQQELAENLKKEEIRIERAGIALGELREARQREESIRESRKQWQYQIHQIKIEDRESILKRDDEIRVSLIGLRKEREELAAHPPMEPEAANRLRQAHAEQQAARRSKESIAKQREETWEKPNQLLQTELERHRDFAWAKPVHLEELKDLERGRHRLEESRAQALARREEVRAELEQAGVSIDRLEEQRQRFSAITSEDSNLLTRYPASAQSTVSARGVADQAADEALEQMATIGRERRGRRILGGALAVIGMGAAAFAVWLALRASVTPSFVALAVTLVSLATGVLLLIRGATHRAVERNKALRALTDARRKLQEIKEQVAERELSLSDLTQRLGLRDTAELLEEHAEYLRLDREGDRLSWVDQDLQRIGEEEASFRSRVWAWVQRSQPGETRADPTPDWNPEDAVTPLRAGIAKMVQLRDQEDRLREQARLFAEQESGAERRANQAAEMAKAVVQSLGTPEDDWEKAFAELETRRQAQERREQIDKILPDYERQALDERTRAAAQEELERLREESNRLEGEMSSREIVSEPPGLTLAESERKSREFDLALEEARERRIALDKEIGRIDEETQGGGKASTLRLEIAELDHEIERARRFQSAVRLAIEQLQKVARQTHALWSEYLARRVNEVLPQLGPEYRGFEVTDNLSYSMVVGGERLDRERLDQVLSTGARTQLGLALRIAVCEFLSRGGENLPILLDDPFSSGDDTRAEAGMRFLAGAVSEDHQVFLITCHQSRVDQLRSSHTDWFEQNVRLIKTPISPLSPAGEGGEIASVRSLGKEEREIS